MEIIYWIIAFVVAITVHEAAHAWMADRLGDPTARLMGRLSLNPLVHYDPVGTTLLLSLVLLRALGAPVIPFGWAKPVMFDPYNLQNPKKDSALISLAGPASNMIIATIAAILLKVSGLTILPDTVSDLFPPVIVLNVSLAIFNLIPIHPLDGGKILVGILPSPEAEKFDYFVNKYGVIAMLFLIFPLFNGVSLASIVVGPLVKIILSLLIPQQFI